MEVRIAYVGDHLHGDVLAAHGRGWHPIAVVGTFCLRLEHTAPSCPVPAATVPGRVGLGAFVKGGVVGQEIQLEAGG